MSAASPAPELDALILAYLADDIDDAALAALDARVRQDGQAARRFAQLSSHETTLAAALRMRAGATAATPRPGSRRRRTRTALPSARWPLAAAALAMVGIVALLIASIAPAPVHKPPIDGIVATITGPVEAQGADGTVQLREGDRLRGGARIVVGDGAEAELVRYDGTRLQLGAATTLRLPTTLDGPIALERGELAVEAAHQPAGSPLVFATPQADAEVVGTTLSLAIGAASTRLAVSEGRVRLTRRVDGAAVMVEAGFTATAGASADDRLIPRRSGALAEGLPATARILLDASFGTGPAGWLGEIATPPGSPAGGLAIATRPTQPGTRFYGEIRSPRLSAALPSGERTYLRFRYLADGFGADDRIKFMLKKADGTTYHGFLAPHRGGWAIATVRLDGAFYAIEPTHRPLPAGEPIAACVFLAAAPDGAVARPGPTLWLEAVIGFTADDDLPCERLEP
jgi:ferric-dicitrate binding protein FerR (iron transport regulator)